MKCSIKKLVSDAAQSYVKAGLPPMPAEVFHKHARFLLSGYEDWCTELPAHDVFMVALSTLVMLSHETPAGRLRVVKTKARKLCASYADVLRVALPHIDGRHVAGIVHRVCDDLRTEVVRNGEASLYEMLMVGQCVVLAVLRAKAV